MARDSAERVCTNTAESRARGDLVGDAPMTAPEVLSGADWADMIDIAKRARSFGKDARAGKSKTFKKYPRPTIR